MWEQNDKPLIQFFSPPGKAKSHTHTAKQRRFVTNRSCCRSIIISHNPSIPRDSSSGLAETHQMFQSD